MKAQSYVKRLIATLLVGTFVTSTGIKQVLAADPSARIISVFQVTGEEVYITRGQVDAAARPGQRLVTGNHLRTGAVDRVELLLDQQSVVVMDSGSHVSVGSTRNRLSLTVEYGQALVNAGPQATNQDLEIRVGNRGLVVRGTLFTIGQTREGVMVVTMLSGAAEVDGVLIEAGELYLANPEGGFYQIIRGFELTDLDSFALNAIIDHADYLVHRAGVFTPAEIQAAQQVLESGRYGNFLQGWAMNLDQASDETSTQTLDALPEQRLPEPGVSVPLLPVTPIEPESPDQQERQEEQAEQQKEEAQQEPEQQERQEEQAEQQKEEAQQEPEQQEEPEEQEEQEKPVEPFPTEPAVVNGMRVIRSDTDMKWLVMHYQTVMDQVILLEANVTLTIPIPQFNGTLIGDGFTVTLAIDTRGTHQGATGMFGVLGPDACVTQLRLAGHVTSDYGNTGALAGINQGMISQVISDTQVIGTGVNTGGLVGSNTHTVRDSLVTATVVGSVNTGGLVGSNVGITVERNLVTGNVIGDTANRVGYLVGENAGDVQLNIFPDSGLGGVGVNEIGSNAGHTFNNTLNDGTYSNLGGGHWNFVTGQPTPYMPNPSPVLKATDTVVMDILVKVAIDNLDDEALKPEDDELSDITYPEKDDTDDEAIKPREEELDSHNPESEADDQEGEATTDLEGNESTTDSAPETSQAPEGECDPAPDLIPYDKMSL